MGRPTISPKERIPGTRRTQVTTVGDAKQTTFNGMIFRAPEAGARIRGVNINFNVAYTSSLANTWKFDVVDVSAGATLNSATVDMSGQTVGATSWQAIDVANGNATLNAYAGLRIVCTASGTPQEIDNAPVAIEWE